MRRDVRSRSLVLNLQSGCDRNVAVPTGATIGSLALVLARSIGFSTTSMLRMNPFGPTGLLGDNCGGAPSTTDIQNSCAGFSWRQATGLPTVRLPECIDRAIKKSATALYADIALCFTSPIIALLCFPFKLRRISADDHPRTFISFAAVRPRILALSSSLSDVHAKMWSTGCNCHG
jgi:hypothetical protein